MREQHERTRREAREALKKVQEEVASLSKPRRRPHSAPDGRGRETSGEGSSSAPDESVQAELEATMARLAELREANAIEAAEAAGRGRAPLASQLRSRGAQLRAAAELVEGGQLDRARELLGGLEETATPAADISDPSGIARPVELRGLKDLEMALVVPPTEGLGEEAVAMQQEALLNEAEQRRDGAKQLRSILRGLRTSQRTGGASVSPALAQRLAQMADDASGAAEAAEVALASLSLGGAPRSYPLPERASRLPALTPDAVRAIEQPSSPRRLRFRRCMAHESGRRCVLRAEPAHR